MFEKLSRQKVRFDSPKGLLTTEDLWDLPLTSGAGKANLDDIAKALHRSLKSVDAEPSFVTPAVNTTNTEMQLKFDAVKHVIAIRCSERDAAAQQKEQKEKKQKILSLIAAKKDEQLGSSSLEELMKMAEAL